MIFISYRRADAGGHAGRVFDRLCHWFDAEVLFYDLDGIDVGDTFPESIKAAIDKAAVLLVLIGPDWLTEINRRA
ncbi:MAG: toll/interleukin-1 receptor domain-containing protein, partial [Propionivibrio sp.]|nr:toll/interleukin-1 receptor domain-containing protein [Propionivibrio sp.]